MADYPGALWAGNTRGTNLSDAETHTTWHDEVMDEVIAVETEIGTQPSGSWSTVALRLSMVGAVCQVSTSTGNTLTSGVTATLSWETEQLDPLGWFTGGAPTVITPNIAGWYRAAVRIAVAADPDNDFTLFNVRVQKNGADVHTVSFRPSAVASVGPSFFGMTPMISMNGSSDAIRVLAAQANTDADAYTPTGFFDLELVYRTP